MTSPSIWIASSLDTAPYIRPHGGADWSMKRSALAIHADLRVIAARQSRCPPGSMAPGARTPRLNPVDLPSLSLDDFVELLVLAPLDQVGRTFSTPRAGPPPRPWPRTGGHAALDVEIKRASC